MASAFLCTFRPEVAPFQTYLPMKAWVKALNWPGGQNIPGEKRLLLETLFLKEG
jgi:hypothetical protein